MKLVLMILLNLISIGLVTLIILQPRAGGAGAIFGGSQEIYRTRRGVEKLLHYITIFLAVLFSVSAAVFIFLG